MTSRRVSPWSNSEVQTFLDLVAEGWIQKELDGSTRNEKVYKEVANLMEEKGYHRTSQQCREKLKKMKSDYRAIKDRNGRSRSTGRKWKWFDQMDAIYGLRPASNGRESGSESATAPLDRVDSDDTNQQELNWEQRDDHIRMLLEDAREARELEAALRREEMLQTAAFHQAFLGVLERLVQAINSRSQQ